MPVMRVVRRLILSAMIVGNVPATALAQRAADPYYEFVLARHLEDEGDNAGAAAALQRAAAADPQSAEIKAELAAFYLRRNQPPDAEKHAKAALAIDAANVEANRVLGFIFSTYAEGERNTPAQTAGYVRDAITHLEKALAGAQGPPDPQLHYTLGRLYLVSGDADKAVQALVRVVNQSPGSVQGRRALAQAQEAAKDLPGAIATLTDIVDAEPRVAADLARYQRAAGMLREAVDSYTKALAVQPNSAALKYQRILTLYDAKDFVRAASFAADAQAQHPDVPGFPRIRASSLYAGGDKTRAIETLEAAAKTFPKDAETQLALADLYGNVGRPMDAERLLRQMIASDPSNPYALNSLGYLLAVNGERLDEAIRLVTRALQLDPDNGAYLDSLGWAHFRRGDLNEAEKYLGQAAELLPRSTEVLDHLGDLHARRGRWDAAIMAWMRALEGEGADATRPAIQKKIDDARAKASR